MVSPGRIECDTADQRKDVEIRTKTETLLQTAVQTCVEGGIDVEIDPKRGTTTPADTAHSHRQQSSSTVGSKRSRAEVGGS